MNNGALPARRTTGRRAALVATALLLIGTTAGLAAPGWKPLPPFGGRVIALAAADGAPLLYAGTDRAGIWRSSNGGATWLPAHMPEPVRAMKLVVDPRNPRVVFAAAQTLAGDSLGVLRSSDGGATWRAVNRGLGDEVLPIVLDLVTDPFDAQKLYAATDFGLFLTRDRGATWQGAGLFGYSITALAIDPLQPGVLVAAGRDKKSILAVVLVSRDGGVTWRGQGGIGGSQLFADLVFHPTSPNTLFAFGWGYPTYVSRDGGATWTSLGQPLADLTFGPGDSLFGAPFDTYGILKSVDGGLTWAQTGLPDGTTQVLRVDGRLYAAGGLGVWISIDNGAHWRPSSRGLSARNASDLTEFRSALYGSFAPEGVLASRTGGTSWQQLRDANHPEGLLLRFLTAGPDALYALEQIGDFTPQEALVRSTDGGASWSELADPGLGGAFTSLAVDPRNPALLYAGSTEQTGNDVPRCHLARSVDTGRSWSCVVEEASVEEIHVERKTSTPYLIAAGNLFALAGGTTLEPRGAGLPSQGTLGFAFDPRLAGTLYAATTEGVFKTVDGGLSWTRAGRGLPAGQAVHSVAVDLRRRGVVYAGLQGRVFRSLDAGRTWRQLGNGLPLEAPIVEILPSASNPRRLYAISAGHGLYWEDPAAR